MSNKSKYVDFCKEELSIPVFSQPWWLDAVCGKDNWDVILIEKGRYIIASFPYYTQISKIGLKHIMMPILTQKLGPYIKYPKNQSSASKLSYEKEILNSIISQLPVYDVMNVNFDYKYTNWLPFYWNGFEQTTRYTYCIDNISDTEQVYNNFEHSKRKNIKKALSQVKVYYDLSCDDFYNNHKMTLLKQGEIISYSYDIFKRIYDAAYLNGQGKVVYCKDEIGNIHAALFVIWDSHSAFDLISTIDPSYRNSGAATLLVYEIIKYLSNKVRVFDFEGSMIEGVEDSFRKFGTIQKPYFQIYKLNSRKSKLLFSIRNIIHAFKN